MRHTIELINPIYWRSMPTKGSIGEARQTGSAVEIQEGLRTILDMYDPQGISKASRQLQWPEDADLETRMAYGRALMDRYGLWLTIS